MLNPCFSNEKQLNYASRAQSIQALFTSVNRNSRMCASIKLDP